MKPALLLRQTQRLSMTPQLRQALHLLQLPALELNRTLEQALEQNLLLERRDEADSDLQDTSTAHDAETRDSSETEVATDWETADAVADWPGAAPELFPEPGQPDVPDLRTHLLWQLELSHPSPRDAAIGTVLIDSLNDDGYLRDSLGNLQAVLAGSDDAPELDEIEAVLHRIQRFDPPGVAARNLGECLLIQLQQRDPACAGHALALRLVQQHLEALAARDHAGLCTQLGVSAAELEQAMLLLHSLNPRPGTALAGGTVDYVQPDILVSHRDGHWIVELNPRVTPYIGVNTAYAAALSGRSANPDLGRQLQEARWLVRSLRMRNETLLRTAQSLVRHQQAFLEYGEEAMRPLLLKDLAVELGLHESTISRVVANKYMTTPRGTFAFRHFFSHELSTDNGDALSATAIRAMIRKLVAQENPRKPLSDDHITRELVSRGVRVARRTVAKYREAMTIPPAYERKRLDTR